MVTKELKSYPYVKMWKTPLWEIKKYWHNGKKKTIAIFI